MIVSEDDVYVIEGPTPRKPIQKISLGKVFYNSLMQNANKEALVDVETGEKYSYQELLQKSVTLAKALSKCGYGRGTIMGLVCENSIHYFLPLLSGLYIGSTISPCNSNFNEDEFLHNFESAKPKVIFCSKATLPKLLPLKERLEFIEKMIIIDSNENIDGIQCINDFVNINSDTSYESTTTIPVEVDVDQDVAFIMSSSGTTGLPKGVMLTHMNILVRLNQASDPRYHPETTEDVIFCFLPLFHAYGMWLTLSALARGQTVAILKRYKEEVFLKTIEQYRLSSLHLVPAVMLFLANSPLVSNYDLSSVKDIFAGGAPISAGVEDSLRKRLGIKTMRQGYGMTEMTFACMTMDVNDNRGGSVGKVMTFMKAKVRDPQTGKSLPPKAVGELCVKGQLVMKGYYENPEETKKTFTSDGWLKTGDLVYYDDDRYFYIVDRIKELIKYKGFQVAPAELEAVLLTHSKVLDAGVVGVPNNVAGELPFAFVVKVPDAPVTENELQDYVAERLSPTKKLRGGVIFVDKIPRGASGKILRKDLRQYLEKYKSDIILHGHISSL